MAKAMRLWTIDADISRPRGSEHKLWQADFAKLDGLLTEVCCAWKLIVPQRQHRIRTVFNHHDIPTVRLYPWFHAPRDSDHVSKKSHEAGQLTRAIEYVDDKKRSCLNLEGEIRTITNIYDAIFDQRAVDHVEGMSPASVLKYRRTHNSILISKILSCRENASPFSLILDTLEQSARQLVAEILRRVKLQKTNVVYISYDSLRKPNNVDHFIDGLSLDERDLQSKLSQLSQPTQRNIIVFDNLYHLIASGVHLPSFLPQFMSPTTSIISIYHADVPLPQTSAYLPDPLTLLHYLATSILTVHSFSSVLARKQAADKSLAEPVFGLQEETEGVLVSLGANNPRGLVLEMEYRRKSGRAVKEWFFVPAAGQAAATLQIKSAIPASMREAVILLEDHPLWATSTDSDALSEVEEAQTSFSLGLTEKQKRDRDGVILPYFDAQTGAGGEGGRILYDMGVEDDFDEEEDEI